MKTPGRPHNEARAQAAASESKSRFVVVRTTLQGSAGGDGFLRAARVRWHWPWCRSLRLCEPSSAAARRRRPRILLRRALHLLALGYEACSSYRRSENFSQQPRGCKGAWPSLNATCTGVCPVKRARSGARTPLAISLRRRAHGAEPEPPHARSGTPR